MDEEESSGEGWIVSFADLMTLLFALFVVLYGLKEEGEKVALGVVSSIRESFLEIPDDIPTEEKKGPLKVGKFVFPHARGDTNFEPVIRRYRRVSNVTKVVNSDIDQIKSVIKVINSSAQAKAAYPLKGKVIEAYEDKDGIVVKISSVFLFKPGEYRLRREQLQMFKTIGAALKGIGRRLIVEGHTDSIPPRNMNNIELSALRAAHVGHFLVANIGISKEKVAVSGYGDARPILSNRTEKGRQVNRRIEIKVRYE